MIQLERRHRLINSFYFTSHCTPIYDEMNFIRYKKYNVTSMFGSPLQYLYLIPSLIRLNETFCVEQILQHLPPTDSYQTTQIPHYHSSIYIFNKTK